ncbi:MAG TPA: hypothetical protein VFX38_03920 [Gammaproteobacteria bacterium]|nr:hypothetical protein [Gammaproteobacteria bacterium]
MKYLSLPALLLAATTAGWASPPPQVVPAPSAPTAVWAIPAGLLQQAFPDIYGHLATANAPAMMKLDFNVQIPVLTGLQILKIALAAPSSGAATDASLIICRTSPAAGVASAVLTCRTNAAALHRRRSVPVPDVSPECGIANLPVTAMRQTYREGIVPYAVAAFFDFARVNPKALDRLVNGIPDPNAALCPTVRHLE